MKPLELFLREIDAAWQPIGSSKQPLHVIGSGALLLQTDYQRGTKDSDILETTHLDKATQASLLALAGRDTALHKRHRMYLEIVGQGLPFLAHKPVWHAHTELNSTLRHLVVYALDVVDVVVSKLARFHSDDRADIQAMTARGLVPQGALVARFEAAKDIRKDTSYADDLPRYVANLNRVERDYLGGGVGDRASAVGLGGMCRMGHLMGPGTWVMHTSASPGCQTSCEPIVLHWVLAKAAASACRSDLPPGHR